MAHLAHRKAHRAQIERECRLAKDGCAYFKAAFIAAYGRDAWAAAEMHQPNREIACTLATYLLRHATSLDEIQLRGGGGDSTEAHRLARSRLINTWINAPHASQALGEEMEREARAREEVAANGFLASIDDSYDHGRSIGMLPQRRAKELAASFLVRKTSASESDVFELHGYHRGAQSDASDPQGMAARDPASRQAVSESVSRAKGHLDDTSRHYRPHNQRSFNSVEPDRSWDEEAAVERRRTQGGVMATQAQFLALFGEMGLVAWMRAKPVAAKALDGGSEGVGGTKQRRVATGGAHLTEAEFIAEYGTLAGLAAWMNAPLAASKPRRPQRPGLGHSNHDTAEDDTDRAEHEEACDRSTPDAEPTLKEKLRSRLLASMDTRVAPPPPRNQWRMEQEGDVPPPENFDLYALAEDGTDVRSRQHLGVQNRTARRKDLFDAFVAASVTDERDFSTVAFAGRTPETVKARIAHHELPSRKTIKAKNAYDLRTVVLRRAFLAPGAFVGGTVVETDEFAMIITGLDMLGPVVNVHLDVVDRSGGGLRHLTLAPAKSKGQAYVVRVTAANLTPSVPPRGSVSTTLVLRAMAACFVPPQLEFTFLLSHLGVRREHLLVAPFTFAHFIKPCPMRPQIFAHSWLLHSGLREHTVEIDAPAERIDMSVIRRVVGECLHCAIVYDVPGATRWTVCGAGIFQRSVRIAKGVAGLEREDIETLIRIDLDLAGRKATVISRSADAETSKGIIGALQDILS